MKFKQRYPSFRRAFLLRLTPVIIALEPEAAAVYCRQRKLREFVEGKGDEVVKDTLVLTKTQYLVIDNGGKNLCLTNFFRVRNTTSFIRII